MNLSFVAVSLIAAMSPAAPSNEWSQWRGPHRDGHALNANLPKEWAAKAPAPIWKLKVGIGYSSPVVSGGRVFIMGREKEGEETRFGIDANSGKVLWSFTAPNSFVPPDPTAGKGPNSTPTVDGDRVYMVGLGGKFHCFNTKTGKVLWSHDFQKQWWGVERSEDMMDKWFPVCGMATSPLVDGKQIIMPVGGKKVGAIASFDRDTGKVLWHAVPERSSYAAVQRVNIAGVDQYVGFSGLRLLGLDVNSHKVLWDQPVKAGFEQTIITPVIHKDMVLMAYDAKPMTAFKISSKDGKLVKETAWTSAELSAYLTTPVIVKDHIIGLDERSRRLVSLNIATGKSRWTSERIASRVTLVAAGDQVLALTGTGDLIVFDPEQEKYTEKARWKVSEAGDVWSYLAVSGSRILVKDKEHLLCYDLKQAK